VDLSTVKQLLGDRQITVERLTSIIDHYDAWVEVRVGHCSLPLFPALLVVSPRWPPP
jgi:hypothetical protein